MSMPIDLPLGKKRILVVEDDPAILDMIAAYLGNAGFEVVSAASGAAMQGALADGDFDLLLLDLNLPDSDGLELARAVRNQSRMGIIMVTERASPDERATGLEIGADDYIPKPFFPRELLARVRNVLERARPATVETEPTSSEVLMFDQWIVDPANRRVSSMDGRDAGLTAAEFELLAFFLRHPQQLLSRSALAEAIEAKKDNAGERSVDILISRIRKKLGAAGVEGPIIETCRGHGYRLTVAVKRPMA
ncbi:MAG: response regulator [Magnetovibrionaceae bacterium]